jgi:hypothetical protein
MFPPTVVVGLKRAFLAVTRVVPAAGVGLKLLTILISLLPDPAAAKPPRDWP